MKALSTILSHYTKKMFCSGPCRECCCNRLNAELWNAKQIIRAQQVFRKEVFAKAGGRDVHLHLVDFLVSV